MTDRELLELAAKALGITIGRKPEGREPWLDGITFIDGGDGGYIKLGVYTVSGADRHGPNLDRWNPLDDDGDALRLAIRLNLSVCFTLGASNAPWGTVMVGYSPWDRGAPIASERYGELSEKHAATRRAIVRAAAEIQRTKELA